MFIMSWSVNFWNYLLFWNYEVTEMLPKGFMLRIELTEKQRWKGCCQKICRMKKNHFYCMWLFFYSEFLWAIPSALLPTINQVTIRILQKKRWQSKAQRLKESNYLISKTTQFQKLWSRPKTKDLKYIQS